jgi:hypothetical protein
MIKHPAAAAAAVHPAVEVNHTVNTVHYVTVTAAAAAAAAAAAVGVCCCERPAKLQCLI